MVSSKLAVSISSDAHRNGYLAGLRDASEAVKSLWAFPVRDDAGASAVTYEVKKQALAAIDLLRCAIEAAERRKVD